MKWLRWGWFCVVLSLPCASVLAEQGGSASLFNAQELAWLSQHRVLKVAVGPNNTPIEYMRDGHLYGLSAEYLQAISRKTGVEFTYVEAATTDGRIALLKAGRADLVSDARVNGTSPQLPGTLLTTPYHVTSLIMVTRTQERVIFDIEDLNGRSIATPSLSTFREALSARAPRSRIVVTHSAEETLDMVVDGRVDVAIASHSYLAPRLQGAYADALQISGVVGGMTVEIAMAVRDDQPMLHAVLQKVLSTVPTEETRRMRANWQASAEFNTLSVKTIARYYADEAALACLVVAMLMALAYQAYRQHRKAVRSEREKTMFLAVMSHEIRSPMNAVLAAVELLRYTKLDKQQRHFAELANSGAATLLRLLDDVLDISKLEAGKLQLMEEPVNVRLLAQNVLDLQQLRASEKNIVLTLTTTAKELGLLLLDKSRISQILHNLVSNAVKFTDVGGVDVRLLVTDIAGSNKRQLQIAVTDSGIGISEQEQARLFRPYSQARQASGSSGGAGLGLVICRELLAMMQGTITLTSRVGLGTTVIVTVPAAVATDHVADEIGDITPTESVPAAATGAADLRGMSILIVEDTPANQEVLAAQVRELGCMPEVTPDGVRAMQQFMAQEFDLVLMDCQLPDTDGYALAVAMRDCEAQEERVRCPIIAISASTGSAHEERCFASGMDGMLSKPIRLAKLKDVIELWCGVSLGIPTESTQKNLSAKEMRGFVAADVAALLRALALGEADDVRRAAHRLHGATLALGWSDVAQASQRLEALLLNGVNGEDEEFRAALRELLGHWSAID